MPFQCGCRSLSFAFVFGFLLIFGPALCSGQFSGSAVSASSALSIPQAQIILPGELNEILHSRRSAKPLVLQVGSRVMFEQAHIPGAQYAGPGSQPAGLESLAAKVVSLPKDAFIVLYCGCCPWNRCPNVGPAFNQLRQSGFVNVKVLYIASNFGDDWVNKGYSVETGK
ncbi:MAG: rhodanese-like domain-containing protein [Terracidiphilus sp.]